MSKLKFEKRIILILMLVLCLFTTGAIFVYRNLHGVIVDITEEAKPDQNLILMKGLLYDLSDAENSVKSYSLTMDPDYLDQFNIKSTDVHAKIEELKLLSSEDDLKKIEELQKLIAQKFEILEELLIVQNEYRVNEALDKVLKKVESTNTQNPVKSNQEEVDSTEAGFFDRLFKKRKEKKEKKEQEEGADEEEDPEGITIEDLDREVTIVKREESKIESELKLRELDLISQDKMVMDQIQTIFTEMESASFISMEGQLNKAEERSSSMKFSIALFCIIACIFLALAGFTVYKYVQRNDAYKKALRAAKNETDLKNKEITDSIQYAKRIQSAILPDLSRVQQHLPESFIYYSPKDIVAGDFYWMVQQGDHVFIAAADCTGHGVPGAMVSVVCYNALNRSVREFGLTEPAKILDKCRELVIETFDEGNYRVNDGMDIALCAINKNSRKVQYAGANNSMYMVKNKTLQEIKADKQPVGRFMKLDGFTNHVFEVEKGDMIYLFTDGFADQFGGPKKKKFKYKPFKQMLEVASIENLKLQEDKIDNTFKNWMGDLEQVDDVCIIGVRF